MCGVKENRRENQGGVHQKPGAATAIPLNSVYAGEDPQHRPGGWRAAEEKRVSECEIVACLLKENPLVMGFVLSNTCMIF